MSKLPSIKKYDHPAGGWGSVKAVASALVKEHVALDGARILLHQNKPDGFACVSCSWANPQIRTYLNSARTAPKPLHGN